MWQISGGEVVAAWDVDRKDSDRSTTQRDLDCDSLEVRVNSNHPVVEYFIDVDQDSSMWQLVRVPQWFMVAVVVDTLVVTQWLRVL